MEVQINYDKTGKKKKINVDPYLLKLKLRFELNYDSTFKLQSIMYDNFVLPCLTCPSLLRPVRISPAPQRW